MLDKKDMKSRQTAGASSSRRLRTVALPKPNLAVRKSLSDALRLRRTTREISATKIGTQVLSNLLFAACGMNRRRGPFGGPGLTAASASNSQEIDLYVALEDAPPPGPELPSDQSEPEHQRGCAGVPQADHQRHDPEDRHSSGEPYRTRPSSVVIEA